MRLGLIFCVACALLLHAAFLLLGGMLLPAAKPDHGTLQAVELLSEVEEDKPEKPDEPEVEPEALETDEEPAPDAQVLENLEAPVTDATPELEAASLGALEAALNGEGGGGDFAAALSFTSGGRIGGTGKGGAADGNMDDAFSLAEMDQKPRPIFQASPMYPSAMRGKKVEGVVSVIFIVDAAGKVSNPRVEKSSHQAFEKPALDAVRKWKFEPGVKGGQRAACKTRVSVRFPAS